MRNDKTRYNASLLDKLTDPDPYAEFSSTSLKTLSKKELRKSVYQELDWILNTNCAWTRDEIEGQERNTLNYGMRDFSCFFPENSENRRQLGRAVVEVISAYEPRLSHVAANVLEMNTQKDTFSLSIEISAILDVDQTKEPMTFIMTIN